jgi:hypothetical protein
MTPLGIAMEEYAYRHGQLNSIPVIILAVLFAVARRMRRCRVSQLGSPETDILLRAATAGNAATVWETVSRPMWILMGLITRQIRL